MEDLLVNIGKCLKPHGLQGHIKIFIESEYPNIIENDNVLQLITLDKRELSLKIKHIKMLSNYTCVKFDGINSPEEAEFLKGASIYKKRSELPELDEDNHYLSDLIGLDVFDSSAGLIGRLESLISSPANDIAVVRGDFGEVLIPWVKEIVKHIDLTLNKIEVDLPEGMLE